MGCIYSMTCRNKACWYHMNLREVREGPGMILFSRTKTLERDILSGDEEAPDEIKCLLESGFALIGVESVKNSFLSARSFSMHMLTVF